MVGRGICPDDYNAMVQAHGNVPLKTHDKTFLRDVPASMRRHHCDERPPRPARRAGPFYGEHKRVREGSSDWGSGKKENIEQAITEKYLAQFPQYRDSFKVYFCKSDDGARFV